MANSTDGSVIGATKVRTSAHSGAAVVTLSPRARLERPPEVALGVTARPAVVLLHRPLAAGLELGLDESLSDQSTHRHDLLLWLIPADVSTMPV